MGDRIQKIISASGLMSRRAAEAAIAAGRVTHNGRTATVGESARPDDEILVDGEALPRQEEKLYILLNKPRGVVTTLHDEKGRRNVSALVNMDGARLYPVGRLDMDSEGLLLMTNDGAFANRVMHPSHEVDKTYLVWVKGGELDRASQILAGPMEIDGHPIRPASVEIKERFPDGGVLEITIHEGRNRQIRKMCAQAGLSVTRLVRVAEGGVRLGGLKSGCWRKLTPEEIDMLLGEGER
ncbi:MAG: rRNA pseudouridine synthase [Oscillospiraceae bacterium]|nr:rRNA pseudouridine synthase [Oscillospiraceae bacterium]